MLLLLIISRLSFELNVNNILILDKTHKKNKMNTVINSVKSFFSKPFSYFQFWEKDEEDLEKGNYYVISQGIQSDWRLISYGEEKDEENYFSYQLYIPYSDAYFSSQYHGSKYYIDIFFFLNKQFLSDHFQIEDDEKIEDFYDIELAEPENFHNYFNISKSQILEKEEIPNRHCFLPIRMVYNEKFIPNNVEYTRVIPDFKDCISFKIIFRKKIKEE